LAVKREMGEVLTDVHPSKPHLFMNSVQIEAVKRIEHLSRRAAKNVKKK